jgi:hypothetical protein
VGFEQRDQLAVRGADDCSRAENADLGCGDAHPLGEGVHRGGALHRGVQLGHDAPGVLRLCGQVERPGRLTQERISVLDDPDGGHLLTRLLPLLGNGGSIPSTEAPFEAVPGV